MSQPLERATETISSLPGIGRKSAQRIAFYLLKQSPKSFGDIMESLRTFYEESEYCSVCGALKAREEPCRFCSSGRNSTVLCVVESPSDIFAFEASGEYGGLYHVLGGVLSPLDGVGPTDLRLQELKQRIDDNAGLEEIIVATNPSVEGNATAHYIKKMFDAYSLRITRIAAGLPLGSQIEYADQQMLAHSLRLRTEI